MMGKLQIASAALGMLSTNCYFLNNTETGETILVDPADEAVSIKNWCINNGKKPVAVLLTHGHFDHMLAADALRKEFGIKIYVGEDEKELLENAVWNLSAMWSSPATLKADEFLSGGQLLKLAGFEIRVIATPGHTAGGVSYYLADEGVLLSGDTLFAGSYGRVDFPTSSMAELARSIREKLLTLPEETVVYPGHGEATTIKYEKAYNPLTQWTR